MLESFSFQIPPLPPYLHVGSDTLLAMQEVQYNTVGYDTKGDRFFHGLQICMQSRHCMPRQRIEYGTTWCNTTGLSTMQSYCSWCLRLAYLHVLQTLQGKASQRIQYDTMGYSTTDHSWRLQFFFQGLHLSMYLRRCKTKQTRGFTSIQRGTVQHTTAGSCSSRAWTSQSCTSDTARKGRRFSRIQHNKYNAM